MWGDHSHDSGLGCVLPEDSSHPVPPKLSLPAQPPLRSWGEDPETFGSFPGTRHPRQVSQTRRRQNCCCLLYTSDAADDLLCVDLGGRRIIKKKKKQKK